MNANALEADWPQGSRVFFLFNPFDREFMGRFLARAKDTATPGSLNTFLFLNLKDPDLPASFAFEPCAASLSERVIWRLMSPYTLHVYRHHPPARVGEVAGALIGLIISLQSYELIQAIALV